jgi:Phage integrase family
MHTAIPSSPPSRQAPWNKGRLTGQKRPLKPNDVWAIRVRLQLEGRKRDLALFNLAIDSKLRGCDLLRLRVDDVSAGGRVRDRGTVIQKKTGRPVQFEITQQTLSSIQGWLSVSALGNEVYLFPSRFRAQPHLSTRQYLRIVHAWVERAGLDGSAYGTHSMRRTKAAQIYKGADLQEDWKPACCAASPRTYQARKHRALSRHRGRRRPQHLGAGRTLNPRRGPCFRQGRDLPTRRNRALRGCCCQMPARRTVTGRSINPTAAPGPAPKR